MLAKGDGTLWVASASGVYRFKDGNWLNFQPEEGLPECDRVMNHALSLPTHHGLTSDDLGVIVEAISDWNP